MMRESDVAEHFKRIWSPYPLHTMINSAEAGWPDRFLQLSHSTVVAIEFKLLAANKSRVYKYNHFRKEQAAWFAKWQRYGGYCMLFSAVIDWREDFVGYDIMTRNEYMEWIKLRDISFVIGERELLKTDNQIRTRMREWLQAQRVHENLKSETLQNAANSDQSTLQERVDA